MGINFDDDNNLIDDSSDNLFEEFEDSIITEDSSLVEEVRKPRNRTFIVVVSVLGGGFLIVLIALIIFSVRILPQRSAEQREESMMIYAEASATAQELTLQAVSIILEPTPTASQAPEDEAAKDTNGDAPEALATATLT